MPVLDERQPHVVLQAATTQINPAAVDQTLPEHMLEPQHDEPSSSEVVEDDDDDDEQLSLLQFEQLQDQVAQCPAPASCCPQPALHQSLLRHCCASVSMCVPLPLPLPLPLLLHVCACACASASACLFVPVPLLLPAPMLRSALIVGLFLQTTLSITSAYLIELPLAVCSLHNLLELSLNVSARPHCLLQCLSCFLVSCCR